MPEKEQLSAKIDPRLKAEIERRAEGNNSQAEVVRMLLWSGLIADDRVEQREEEIGELEGQIEYLEDRLEKREDRIDELEEQLARRSQVEEKVDTLVKREEDPDPPWPVRWYRWLQR